MWKSIDRGDAVSFISRYLLNEALIEQYQDKWAWRQLSRNEALPWSLALIEQYKVKWDWEKLSENEALPWSLALIEQYKDQWEWGYHGLSGNKALPWSLALIEQYKDQWDWVGLSRNEALRWSLALIEQFKDQWKWEVLCNSAVACLPKLSMQDIDEVMNHHFPSESLSKQVKQPPEPIKPMNDDLDDDLPF